MAEAGVVHDPLVRDAVPRRPASRRRWREIAPVALRYGAHELPRLPLPRRPLQVPPLTAVPTKLDWERYWYGPEFSRWRAEHAGWYQVPVVYAPAHEIASGALEHESVELDV